MTSKRELEGMRMPEVEAYLDGTDIPTALVPVGTTEQHGQHLALGTDAMIPEEICRRIASDVNALVAPRVSYGASDMHAGYQGITYLRYTTLATMLRDLAYSLCESGFTDVVFISGHLTNDYAAKVGSNQVSHDLPSNKYVYAFPYWDALSAEEMEEYLSFETGWHANIGETAAMMAIDETTVDLDAVEVDDPEMPMDPPNPGALLDPLLIAKGSFYRVSESGTWGDPSDATAERGEEYFEMITEADAALINTFQDAREDIYKRDSPTEDERFR
jgi:creatinine amidohydrolase